MSKTCNNAAITHAYQAHANDIAKLIELLQRKLAVHAQQTPTWCHVGELANLRSQLVDLVEPWVNFSRIEIEAQLAASRQAGFMRQLP
jgi:hypothetical protein